MTQTPKNNPDEPSRARTRANKRSDFPPPTWGWKVWVAVFGAVLLLLLLTWR